MKKFLLVLCLTGSLVAAEIASGPVLSLSAAKVTHNSILLVKVFDKNAKSLKIKESVFPLFAGQDGASTGVLLGVPAWWTAGEYVPEVDGKKTELVLEVLGRAAKTEKITIDKTKLVKSEETSTQGKLLAEEISFLLEKKYWIGKFIKPVAGRVSTEYGVKRTVNGSQGGMHRGIDIAADEGVEVIAANDGVVKLSRNHILTGNTVVLNHGAGVVSVYYHMSALLVKENEKVKKGEVIGKVGSTGVSTGAHLHWGIWIFGVDVNPLELIEKEMEF